MNFYEHPEQGYAVIPSPIKKYHRYNEGPTPGTDNKEKKDVKPYPLKLTRAIEKAGERLLNTRKMKKDLETRTK